jgi:UDP-N-acetylmuramoyl-L-alanyl-D-glutamate--2,6-diaminopimelate ligase
MIQELKNYLYHLPLAVFANFFYQQPSEQLKVIGVTGTSGKTTTAHLLYHILNQNGFKVALISTIAAKIGNKELDTGLHVTNPDPFPLQKLLKDIVKEKYQYVILEVTSHGLDQFRTYGINFAYGVITNITHEHLDYHKSLERYRKAKFRLLDYAKVAVLNRHDASLPLAQKKLTTEPLIFDQDSVENLPEMLPGDFNKANVAAAQNVALDLGLSTDQIDTALKTFPGIPGRMEIIIDNPYTVVVDFAHKPDALEKALLSLRSLASPTGRTIAVFGCASERDTLKRPIMGEIAGRLADVTILTAEDPRKEDVNKIIREIAAGWDRQEKPKSHRLYQEPDRQKAINLAINLIKPGDCVGFFGKSHEKSMCFGTIEYPWDEFKAVKKALKLKKKK